MYSYMLYTKIKAKPSTINVRNYISVTAFGIKLQWFKESEFIGTLF